jgi:hypothetical protein
LGVSPQTQSTVPRDSHRERRRQGLGRRRHHQPCLAHFDEQRLDCQWRTMKLPPQPLGTCSKQIMEVRGPGASEGWGLRCSWPAVPWRSSRGGSSRGSDSAAVSHRSLSWGSSWKKMLHRWDTLSKLNTAWCPLSRLSRAVPFRMWQMMDFKASRGISMMLSEWVFSACNVRSMEAALDVLTCREGA